MFREICSESIETFRGEKLQAAFSDDAAGTYTIHVH